MAQNGPVGARFDSKILPKVAWLPAFLRSCLGDEALIVFTRWGGWAGAGQKVCLEHAQMLFLSLAMALTPDRYSGPSGQRWFLCVLGRGQLAKIGCIPRRSCIVVVIIIIIVIIMIVTRFLEGFLEGFLQEQGFQ